MTIVLCNSLVHFKCFLRLYCLYLSRFYFALIGEIKCINLFIFNLYWAPGKLLWKQNEDASQSLSWNQISHPKHQGLSIYRLLQNCTTRVTEGNKEEYQNREILKNPRVGKEQCRNRLRSSLPVRNRYNQPTAIGCSSLQLCITSLHWLLCLQSTIRGISACTAFILSYT